MKRIAFLLLICCLLFSSCGVEADFVISRESISSSHTKRDEDTRIFVLINKNSKKYHLDPDCTYVSRMSAANRLDITVPDEAYLEEHGYSACKRCAGEK